MFVMTSVRVYAYFQPIALEKMVVILIKSLDKRVVFLPILLQILQFNTILKSFSFNPISKKGFCYNLV